jgi:hypothetical protein
MHDDIFTEESAAAAAILAEHATLAAAILALGAASWAWQLWEAWRCA